MNIYRGCTHGCIYCDSRSMCYGMDHLFEDVEVKSNAAELLENALKHKRKKCMMVTGSMSDPYIAAEESLCLTRKCLELIDSYGFGLSIQTKSSLILRDLEILKDINAKSKCVVQITLTAYDENLCRILEPDVATAKERIGILKTMRDNGIPTIVWLSPILPFISDNRENIERILDCCAQAKVYGIICFGMGLTLRAGNREYFYKELDRHFPGLKEVYKQKYGSSYWVFSDRNESLMNVFRNFCSKKRIICDNERLFAYMHKFEDKQSARQISLFD